MFLNVCLKFGFCCGQLKLTCLNQNTLFFVQPQFSALCCGELSSYGAFSSTVGANQRVIGYFTPDLCQGCLLYHYMRGLIQQQLASDIKAQCRKCKHVCYHRFTSVVIL